MKFILKNETSLRGFAKQSDFGVPSSEMQGVALYTSIFLKQKGFSQQSLTLAKSMEYQKSLKVIISHINQEVQNEIEISSRVIKFFQPILEKLSHDKKKKLQNACELINGKYAIIVLNKLKKISSTISFI